MLTSLQLFSIAPGAHAVDPPSSEAAKPRAFGEIFQDLQGESSDDESKSLVQKTDDASETGLSAETDTAKTQTSTEHAPRSEASSERAMDGGADTEHTDTAGRVAPGAIASSEAGPAASLEHGTGVTPPDAKAPRFEQALNSAPEPKHALQDSIMARDPAPLRAGIQLVQESVISPRSDTVARDQTLAPDQTRVSKALSKTAEDVQGFAGQHARVAKGLDDQQIRHQPDIGQLGPRFVRAERNALEAPAQDARLAGNDTRGSAESHFRNPESGSAHLESDAHASFGRSARPLEMSLSAAEKAVARSVYINSDQVSDSALRADQPNARIPQGNKTDVETNLGAGSRRQPKGHSAITEPVLARNGVDRLTGTGAATEIPMASAKKNAVDVRSTAAVGVQETSKSEAHVPGSPGRSMPVQDVPSDPAAVRSDAAKTSLPPGSAPNKIQLNGHPTPQGPAKEPADATGLQGGTPKATHNQLTIDAAPAVTEPAAGSVLSVPTERVESAAVTGRMQPTHDLPKQGPHHGSEKLPRKEQLQKPPDVSVMRAPQRKAHAEQYGSGVNDRTPPVQDQTTVKRVVAPVVAQSASGFDKPTGSSEVGSQPTIPQASVPNARGLQRSKSAPAFTVRDRVPMTREAGTGVAQSASGFDKPTRSSEVGSQPTIAHAGEPDARALQRRDSAPAFAVRDQVPMTREAGTWVPQSVSGFDTPNRPSGAKGQSVLPQVGGFDAGALNTSKETTQYAVRDKTGIVGDVATSDLTASLAVKVQKNAIASQSSGVDAGVSDETPLPLDSRAKPNQVTMPVGESTAPIAKVPPHPETEKHTSRQERDAALTKPATTAGPTTSAEYKIQTHTPTAMPQSSAAVVETGRNGRFTMRGHTKDAVERGETQERGGEATVFESRVASGVVGTNGALATQPQRTMAQAVLSQISQALPKLEDGMIEVRLSPEELGRIKMQMTPGEAGMTVHITADRPETLDLMRRNIELLQKDLEAAGFAANEFSFGQDQSGNNEQSQRSGQRGLSADTAEAPQQDGYPARGVQNAGLDLRL